VFATAGGEANLNTVSITSEIGTTGVFHTAFSGLILDGTGSKITATNTEINLGDDSAGMQLTGLPDGCSLTVTNTKITVGNLVNFNGNEQGVFIFASADHPNPLLGSRVLAPN
jgi:hypothetical protein